MSKTANIEYGNSKYTVEISETNKWSGGKHEREYITLSTNFREISSIFIDLNKTHNVDSMLEAEFDTDSGRVIVCHRGISHKKLSAIEFMLYDLLDN